MATVTASSVGAWPSMYGGPSQHRSQPLAHYDHHHHHHPHHQQQQQYQHHPASSAYQLHFDDAAARASPHSMAASSASYAAVEQAPSSSSYRSTDSHSHQGYYAPTREHSDLAATGSAHVFDSRLYLSALPATTLPSKRRGRTKLYANDEARQAAKLIQKQRRREQNRNAQRRLRDRKEEHIFKLQGEVAELRRQDEKNRSELQALEDMIRRLLGEREDLQRRLGLHDEVHLGRDNALGLVDPASSGSAASSRSGSTSDQGAETSRSSSSSSSATSASVETPRSSSTSSPFAVPRSERLSPSQSRLSGSEACLQLPKIKFEPSSPHANAPLIGSSLLPPVSGTVQLWSLH